MGQKIYEFAVIYTPLQTKEQNDRGEEPRSEIIVDVQRVLADDDKQAMLLAARAIPSDYANRLSQVDIAVRPF